MDFLTIILPMLLARSAEEESSGPPTCGYMQQRGKTRGYTSFESSTPRVFDFTDTNWEPANFPIHNVINHAHIDPIETPLTIVFPNPSSTNLFTRASPLRPPVSARHPLTSNTVPGPSSRSQSNRDPQKPLLVLHEGEYHQFPSFSRMRSIEEKSARRH